MAAVRGRLSKTGLTRALADVIAACGLGRAGYLRLLDADPPAVARRLRGQQG